MNGCNGTTRSKKRWWPSALLAALLAMAGCADSRTPAAELATLEKQGHHLFLDHCALCHGKDARGGHPLPDMTTVPADLTRIAERHGGEFPFGEVARFIDGRIPIEAHRSPEMPVWGRVLGSGVADPAVREAAIQGKVWALVFYLHSIQAE